jgi:hypothetical protein
MPVAGVVGNCEMPCSGDETEFCGGSALISLYQKCTGSACTNAQFGLNSSSIDTDSSAASTSLAALPTTLVTMTATDEAAAATAAASATTF